MSVNLLTLLEPTHRETGLEQTIVCARLHTRGVPLVSVHISLEGEGHPQKAPGVSGDGQAVGPGHLGHTWDRPSPISPWAMQPASPIRSLTSIEAPYREPASPRRTRDFISCSRIPRNVMDPRGEKRSRNPWGLEGCQAQGHSGWPREGSSCPKASSSVSSRMRRGIPLGAWGFQGRSHKSESVIGQLTAVVTVPELMGSP